MGAHLYLRNDGTPVTVTSYSSGAKFDACPRDYAYEKIQGYRRKGKKASLEFGKAFEAAIQFFHANGLKPGSGVDEFKRLWLAFKEMTDLAYTDKEGSWADLYRAGSDLLRLYELHLPNLPIVDPVFQVNYRREVLPGTEYAGIEHTAFVDMVSKAPWVHPLLPRVDIPAGSSHRPLIIDIKSAGAGLGTAGEMLALDPQLRQYAATAHIQDVAFLWAVKAKHGSFDKGTQVTLLEDCGDFKAGAEMVCVYVQKTDETTLVGVVPADVYLEVEEALKGKRGKALEEVKEICVRETGVLASPDILTRCKLQFAATRVSEEAMRDAMQDVGRQIVEIVNCSQTGNFPQRPSVRFPNMKCQLCAMQGLCLNKPALVEQMLVQITPSAKPAEKDWLDELFEENGE